MQTGGGGGVGIHHLPLPVPSLMSHFFPSPPFSSHPAVSCWHQLLPLLFLISAETPQVEGSSFYAMPRHVALTLSSCKYIPQYGVILSLSPGSEHEAIWNRTVSCSLLHPRASHNRWSMNVCLASVDEQFSSVDNYFIKQLYHLRKKLKIKC